MELRISTSIMNKTLASQIQSNQNKFYELQQQAISGNKYSSINENPLAAIKIMSLNDKSSVLEGYQNNTKLALSEYNVLDSALSTVTNQLQRINELALDAANQTKSPEALDAIKVEIDQIKENLLDVANTNYNGAYIFSGANTDTNTYSVALDGSIVYNGTEAIGNYARQLEVSKGIYLTLNTTGDTIFGNYDAADPTKSNGIFKTLTDLSTAVETGDIDTIRNCINSNNDDLNNVLSVRTQFATKANKAELTQNTLDDSLLKNKEDLSDVKDADVVEVYSDLTYQQYVLQASMQVYSMSMNQSLMNYI